jgi:hypothetical protein
MGLYYIDEHGQANRTQKLRLFNVMVRLGHFELLGGVSLEIEFDEHGGSVAR